MRIKTLSLLLALSLGHTLPAIAAETVTASQSQLQAYTSVEGITEYRSPNGLRVLLAPDASKPTTTVNVTYLVGVPPRKLWRNRHGPLAGAHAVQGHAQQRQPDAGTRQARHAVQRHHLPGPHQLLRNLPANDDNLRWALEMEADRMVNSKIARSDLDTEFSVVRNEMEMGRTIPAACCGSR